MIAAIACIDYNLGIGYKNQLLVSIKDDLKRFKELTSDAQHPTQNVVIMGRKTWDSIPKKPLLNRVNWVITRNPDEAYKHYTVGKDDNVYFLTLDEAKRLLDEVRKPAENVSFTQDFWIIGGGFIYKELFEFCDTLYLTKVCYAFGKRVDTYFPDIDYNEWEEIEFSRSMFDKTNELDYYFATYKRKALIKGGDTMEANSNKTEYTIHNYWDGLITTDKIKINMNDKEDDVMTNESKTALDLNDSISSLNATVDPDKLNSIIPPAHLYTGTPFQSPDFTNDPNQLTDKLQDVLKSVVLTPEEEKELDEKANKVFDDVERPKHYTDGNIEVIDFIEDKKLGFCLGNVVKYVARAGKKKSGSLDDDEKEIQDLKKARWYLNRRIRQCERKLCCP